MWRQAGTARRLLWLGCLAWPPGAAACGACRPLVAARIAEQPLLPMLLMVAGPLVVVTLLAALIHGGGRR